MPSSGAAPSTNLRFLLKLLLHDEGDVLYKQIQACMLLACMFYSFCWVDSIWVCLLGWGLSCVNTNPPASQPCPHLLSSLTQHRQQQTALHPLSRFSKQHFSLKHVPKKLRIWLDTSLARTVLHQYSWWQCAASDIKPCYKQGRVLADRKCDKYLLPWKSQYPTFQAWGSCSAGL